MKLINFINKESNTILYIVNDGNDSFYEQFDCNIALLQADDWERELTPYSARINSKYNYVSDSQQTLSQLAQIKKEIEQNLKIEKRYFVGYSLAGLFAYYLLTKDESFNGAVCCSSSFWYPDFVEYVKEHPLKNKRIYFSLGDQESKGKNKVFASVGKNTEEIAAIASVSNECYFTYVPGNHFFQSKERIKNGILWLLEKV